jgi:translation initiation factor IF-3
MQQMAITNSQQPASYRIRINQYIKALQVRLVKEDGTSEIMETRTALKLAKEQGLDLVEINSKAQPVIVRILEYGKYCYELSKKAKADKKNQQVQELKEITFKPNIDSHDLDHKLEKIKEIIAEGNRCKITCRFRGREITHSENGRTRIEWIIQQLGDFIAPNPQISLEDKFMWALVSPNKNKAQN